MSEEERETGNRLMPKFGDDGLIAAMVVSNEDSEPLMLAYMNQDALNKTIETGFVYFYSRSQRRLWMKGETSGNKLRVEEIRIDCDQDALWIKASPEGPACHTGKKSCFYRKIDTQGGGLLF